MPHRLIPMVDYLPPLAGAGLFAAGDAMPLPGAEYVTTTGILMIVLWFVGRVVIGYLDTHAKRESERDKASVEDRRASQGEVKEYQLLVKSMLESHANQLMVATERYHAQAGRVDECLGEFRDAQAVMKSILDRMSDKHEAIRALLDQMVNERPCLLRKEHTEGAN